MSDLRMPVAEGLFLNREHAGRALAAKLMGLELVRPMICGISRGGLKVAASVSKGLGLAKVMSPPPKSVALGDAKGRSVILVDDGMATTSALITALSALRAQSPLELIAAIPIVPPVQHARLEAQCDRLVCLFMPPQFFAISQFYIDLDPISDEEIPPATVFSMGQESHGRGHAP